MNPHSNGPILVPSAHVWGKLLSGFVPWVTLVQFLKIVAIGKIVHKQLKIMALAAVVASAPSAR